MPTLNFIIRKMFIYVPLILLVMVIISTRNLDRVPQEITSVIHSVKYRITLPPIRLKGSRTVKVGTSPAKNSTEPPPGENIQCKLQEPATRVFYNRVPKCGSRGVLTIVRKLSRRLNFNYVSSRVYSQHYLINQDELEFIEEFQHMKTPLFYDRYLHYVDFERYNFESPVYINLVREPFDRLVSAYYFLQDKYRKKIKSENMTFDECIEKRSAVGSCLTRTATITQVPYFCGNNPICRMPSKEALLRAKHNIVQHYLVVGTTKNMTAFFETLEILLPNFFRSAPELFRKEESFLHEKFRSKNRKETTEKLREALDTELMYDTDLYKWTCQRFYMLYKKVMDGKR